MKNKSTKHTEKLNTLNECFKLNRDSLRLFGKTKQVFSKKLINKQNKKSIWHHITYTRWINLIEKAIKAKSGLYSSSKISPRGDFTCLLNDDWDNHDKIDRSIWELEKSDFQNKTNLNHPSPHPSPSGSGDHELALIHGSYDECTKFKLDTPQIRTAFMRFLITTKHLTIQTLLTQYKTKNLGYDCLGKPAFYDKNNNMIKQGDCVFLPVHILKYSKEQLIDKVKHYSLTELVFEIQRLLDLVTETDTQQYRALIKHLTHNRKPDPVFDIYKNFNTFDISHLTQIIPFTAQSVKANNNNNKNSTTRFGLPHEETNAAVKALLKSKGFTDVRVDLKTYNRKGRTLKADTLHTKQIIEIAEAFVCCAEVSKNINEGNEKYQYTVGRKMIKAHMLTKHKAGLFTYKNATNDQIKFVEQLLISWGIIECKDRTYKFGAEGHCCKFTVNVETLFNYTNKTEENRTGNYLLQDTFAALTPYILKFALNGYSQEQIILLTG